MFSQYIPKRYAQALLKHILAISVFFPYYYSHNNNLYYADFILANFFVLLSMVTIITSWKLNIRRNSIFLVGLFILILSYNIIFTYMNIIYHRWYGDQINTTLVCLFFMILLLVEDSHSLIDTTTIRSCIHMIVISNILSLCFRTLDKYERLFIFNTSAEFREYPGTTKGYAWLYSHKSQYALILLICIAFFVVYRKTFSNKITYILSLIILLTALFFSDSYTTMGATLLIFIGQFLDYLLKAKWWKKILAAISVLFSLNIIIQKLYNTIISNRDISILGGRTYIWEVFIELIRNNPNGVDAIFGQEAYYIEKWEQWGLYTNNCHNIFLNHMFRYSIPVGGIYASIFLILMLFSIKRNFSFLTISIWVAILIPINMDHSLTTTELPLFLLLLYTMFFRNRKAYAYNKSPQKEN